MNPFIQSQGFAKTGMLTVVIGALLNLILDPVFIYGFGWGVEGAALATILSQMVSAVWVLAFLCGKKAILKLRLSALRPRRRCKTDAWNRLLLRNLAYCLILQTQPVNVQHLLLADFNVIRQRPLAEEGALLRHFLKPGIVDA